MLPNLPNFLICNMEGEVSVDITSFGPSFLTKETRDMSTDELADELVFTFFTFLKIGPAYIKYSSFSDNI